jgi:hypothetical protein
VVRSDRITQMFFTGHFRWPEIQPGPNTRPPARPRPAHCSHMCGQLLSPSAAPNQSIPNKKTSHALSSLILNSAPHTHTHRIYQYKTGSLRLGEYKTLDNYCLFIYLLAHLVMDRQLLSTQQEEAVILVHNPCYSTIPYSLIRRI